MAEAQREVSKLNKRLFMERLEKKRERNNPVDDRGMADFTQSHVVEKIGLEKILAGSPSTLRREFDDIANRLPRQYLDDLERHGLFDSGLTPSGARFLRELAMKHHNA